MLNETFISFSLEACLNTSWARRKTFVLDLTTRIIVVEISSSACSSFLLVVRSVVANAICWASTWECTYG